MPVWKHRNGETELPTIEGWYWFEGRKTRHPKRMNRRVMVPVWQGNDGLRARYDSMRSDTVDKFTGQWWGPVTPPWEENG